jgi:hypothetical protein
MAAPEADVRVRNLSLAETIFPSHREWPDGRAVQAIPSRALITLLVRSSLVPLLCVCVPATFDIPRTVFIAWMEECFH